MSFKITINKTNNSRISQLDPENIPFGKIFTDHMFACDFQNGEWVNGRIVPFGPIELMPTLSALHYGQSIFEGMKAFKNLEGEINFFRPLENWKRLNKSAERMCMPEIPQEIFMSGLNSLVSLDENWVPNISGSSLYIRPFMFATDDFLGVRQSDNYCFMIYACPVNKYYSKSLKVKIEKNYSRSAKGGVGAAKCAGNYASAMYPTKLAQNEGFDQVLWTDSIQHKWLEETGTSNVFIKLKDKVLTPSVSDTLLDGVTRKTIVQLIKDLNIEMIERPISVEELINWHKNNELEEMFVTGTAATITPILLFSNENIDYKLDENIKFSLQLKNTLTQIRSGEIEDKHQWMLPLKSTVEI